MIGILKSRIQKAVATTPGGDEPTRWVVIAIVSWAESVVMQSKLRSVNIPCLLQRETAGVVLGITIGPLGEVRVLVPEPFCDDALDVLSEGTPSSDDDVFNSEEAGTEDQD